jgi:ribosome-binding factor A
VRFTPTLTFIRDTVTDSVHRMEELLARARAADADVARVREGAIPAGDPDPYRTSGGDDEQAGQSNPPDDDAGRVAARGGAGQSNQGAPTTNGEGADDDDQLED